MSRAAAVDTGLVLRTVSEPDVLWALKPQWDALWRSADGSHAQSERSCFHAWHNDRDPSPRRLHVITGWLGDRLALLWPLVVRRRHRLWNSVMQLGPDAAEVTAMLIEPGPDASIHAATAWQALLRTCRADIVRLPRVQAGTPLHAALPPSPDGARERSLARGNRERGRVLTAEPDVAPYLPWDGTEDWDGYYAGLNGSYRKVQNKKRRQLSEAGTMTFSAAGEAARQAELAGWLLEQKRKWARQTGKQGPWITAPAYDRYLRALAGDPSAGEIALFTVSVDGAVIAAQLASVGSRHVDWIIAAFDPAWNRFSPGMILNEYCLRWALERGLSVEFGTGNEENKRFWCRGTCHEMLSYRIAGTRWGSAIEAVRVAAQRARPVVQAFFERGPRGAAA